MDRIRILDKEFVVSMKNETIQEKVKALAERINHDYESKNPIMICILNGAFMFAADLVRYLNFQPEIVFARFASYEGTETTGKVTEVMGVTTSLAGRDVIIVEDIVDTGITMYNVLPLIRNKEAASIKIACLLQKPDKLQVDLTVDYCAMEIPNDFIVGYGLDYDGFGRNYKDIYTLAK